MLHTPYVLTAQFVNTYYKLGHNIDNPAYKPPPRHHHIIAVIKDVIRYEKHRVHLRGI